MEVIGVGVNQVILRVETTRSVKVRYLSLRVVRPQDHGCGIICISFVRLLIMAKLKLKLSKYY